MTLFFRLRLLPLLAITCFASACDNGSVRNTLGLNRKAPDEFRVVSRPPLSVPPEFNLRPPAAPGETAPDGMEEPAYKEAQSLMMGESGGGLRPGMADTAVMPVTADDPASTADSLFLQNAGADKADGSVRQKLQQEEAQEEYEDKSLLDELRSSEKNEPVVDAKKEKERLDANKEGDKPVTEGETPMVKPKDTGPLGRMLGY